MARVVCILSPAKSLDTSLPVIKKCSQPSMLESADELIDILRKKSQKQVQSLLGVSANLAKLNYDRYQSFMKSDEAKKVTEPTDTFKQAALAFDGPAFQGLEASKWSDDDLEYAQSHLRILCGLYGALRPLDLIQPYRLEMGQKLDNPKGKDLYSYWGSSIATESLNPLFRSGDGEKIIVNVASNEYSKSVDEEALADDIRVIQCVFQDGGKVKAAYAKRARGLMCRYIVQGRVETLEKIKAFDVEGYVFQEDASDDKTLVFNRSPDKQKAVLAEIRAKRKRDKESGTSKKQKVE